MSFYRFGTFVLDVQERRLVHDGEPVPLTPRVFDTLVYLVERQGHLVAKEELIQAVWNDSFVEDGNLPRTIHILRKALAVGGEEHKYIETIPTKGYRFVAPANPKAILSEPLAVAKKLEPQAPAIARSTKKALAGIAAVLFLVALLGAGWRAADQNGFFGRNLPPTDSGAALMKYEEGRFHMERQYIGDYARALESFEAAIALDPHFAAAYAGKADAELFLYWESGSHDDIAKSRLATNKALELDPHSPYAHVLRCRILATYDWDFAAAESECRRAIELDPKYHEARRELAFLLNAIGRRDDALKEMDIAIALAPTSFNKRSRGLLLYFNRRFEEAITQLKQVEATDPEYAESSRWIARSLEQMKDYSDALEFLIRDRQWSGARSEDIGSLRIAFMNGGWPQVLRASLPKSQSASTMETAGTFAQLGENDRAFKVLDAMVESRRVMIVHMDSDPRLDPLRTDPRFEQLAKRVGLR